MTALIVPGEATAVRPPLVGRAALGRFAGRFVDELMALTEAGR